MKHQNQQENFKKWLEEINEIYKCDYPELLPLFKIYSTEAVFGLSCIQNDLARLKPNDVILEIGAGVMLLSCHLKREGFNVVALDPITEEFSHFHKMRHIILKKSLSEGYYPDMLHVSVEELSDTDRFDYVFSINVMEHVENLDKALTIAYRSLKKDAIYRFVCPNYLFPYEPHFNIPTFFSKKVTKNIMANRIFKNKSISDPLTTWNSLNWINVLSVKRIARQINGAEIIFNKKITGLMLSRIISDPLFSSRRSLLIRQFVSLFVRLKFHHITKLFPAVFHPVIDCSIKKLRTEI